MKRTVRFFCFLLLAVCFLSACGKAETEGKPYLTSAERSALEQQFFADLSFALCEEDVQFAEITLRNTFSADLLKVRIFQAETKEQLMEIARLPAGTEAGFFESRGDWETLLGDGDSLFYMDYIVGDYQYRSRNYSVRTETRAADAVFYLETDDGLLQLDVEKGISFPDGIRLSGLSNYTFYEIRPKRMERISPSYGSITPYYMTLECRVKRHDEKNYSTLVAKVKDKDGLVYDSSSIWIDSSTGTGDIYFYSSYQTGIPEGDYTLAFETVD